MSKIDYDYNFYAIDKHNKIVYGFEDKFECIEYCIYNDYKFLTKDQVQDLCIDIFNEDSWSDEYAEYK